MLHRDAFRLEERRGDISIVNEYNLSQAIGKAVECYMDDIAVKSRAKGAHIANLKRAFNIMRVYQLKMNPTNPSWG